MLLQECVQHLLRFFILSSFHSLLVNIFFLFFHVHQEKHLQEANAKVNSSPALPAFVQIVELIFMNNALHP